MKKIILSSFLIYAQFYAYSTVYAQNNGQLQSNNQENATTISQSLSLPLPLKTVNIDIENLGNKKDLSATGEFVFNYNQKTALFLATELKENKMNANIIGFQGSEKIENKISVINSAHPDFIISLGFGILPAPELKFWDYEGRKLSYSDDMRGFSIFLNTNNPDMRTTAICAREIANTLQKVGFPPNWAYNRNNKLIFQDLPIYQEESNQILKNATAPALRIEPGVLSHRKESQSFDSENIDIAFVKSISIGLNNCMKSSQ